MALSPRQLRLPARRKKNNPQQSDLRQAGRTNFHGSPCLLERLPATTDDPHGTHSPWAVALICTQGFALGWYKSAPLALEANPPGVDFWGASQLRLFLKLTHYRLQLLDDCGGAFDDEADLMVVVVAVAVGSGLGCGGYAGAGGLVGEGAAGFLAALVVGGEKDRRLVLAHARPLPVG